MVYLSGMVPPVLDPTKAPGDSVAAYGDTRTQTVGVLKAIEAELKSLHLGMGDVVKMQVFLVAPPASAGRGKAGRMDFAGFMQGYTQFFGTAA